MPPPKYIKDLQKQIRATFGCGSRHFTTVPVTDVAKGKVRWQGNVEVFDLTKHPEARTCYAWSFEQGGKRITTALLGSPAIGSAEDAVKFAMKAEASAS